MTIEGCVRYLCVNDADGPDQLCGPCRASDNLLLTVNDALEAFLLDRFPPRVEDDSPLFDRDSPVRAEIREASEYLGQGLVRLIALAIGKEVCVCSGAWLDPWIYRWYGSLGWDISEDQDGFTPITNERKPTS